MNDHKRPEHGSEEHSGGRGHRHGHGHNSHGPAHSHQHGVVNPDIAASGRGLWVVKWSFVGLFVTAALQIMVFYVSNSIGLLADTIHNFADAGTAVPLGIAFLFTRMKPTQRFPYGYGRVEDLAGMLVVLTILASAGIDGVASHRGYARSPGGGSPRFALSVVSFLTRMSPKWPTRKDSWLGRCKTWPAAATHLLQGGLFFQAVECRPLLT